MRKQSMAVPDPTQASVFVDFIIRNLDAIVTGAVVILLTVLRFLGRKEPAQAATDIIREKPVTHDEVDAKLLRCQLKVTETMTTNFNDFRKELLSELRLLHIRLNKEDK